MRRSAPKFEPPPRAPTTASNVPSTRLPHRPSRTSIQIPRGSFVPDQTPLTDRLQGHRKLFGPVPLRHVDDGLHRRGEFVKKTHFGKIPLRYATKRLRCDPVEQDYAEIAVFPPCRRAGVEFFPTKRKSGAGMASPHPPMRDDVE